MALTENSRYTAALGPIKLELINITSDATDDDTIDTRLVRVLAATILSANTDLTGTADPASVTVSGKTLTLRDPAAQDYLLLVVGF